MNVSGVETDQGQVVAQQEVVVVEQQAEEQEMVEAHTAVVSVVEAGSQEVLRQVHFTMEVDGTTQEQQVRAHALSLLCVSLSVESQVAVFLLLEPGGGRPVSGGRSGCCRRRR